MPEGIMLFFGSFVAAASGYMCYLRWCQGKKLGKSKEAALHAVKMDNQYKPTDLSQLKQRPNQKRFIAFRNVVMMQNGSLFSLSIRDVPVLWKNGPYIFPKFVENLTGEDFIFQRNKQQIRAALKNVNLNAGLLAVENPPVIENPFGSAKQQRCNVEVQIFPKGPMTLIGLIGYSLTQKRFVIELSFLCQTVGDLTTIEEYWNTKINPVRVQKIFFFCVATLVSYFFVLKPLHSLFTRWLKPARPVEDDDLSYFRLKQRYAAKEANLLLCELCRARTVSVVFECGHLLICEKCLEEGNRYCSACRKRSYRTIRIYP